MEVKRGQVWRLGKHYLMCGDATEREDVKKLLRGDKVDKSTLDRSTV